MSAPPRCSRLAPVVFALLAVTGCEEKPATTTTKPIGATAKATASANAAPTAKLDELYKDEDVPVAADFEAKAEEQINAENYKDELAKEHEALVGSKPDGGTP
jgi:hypothetical protein